MNRSSRKLYTFGLLSFFTPSVLASRQIERRKEQEIDKGNEEESLPRWANGGPEAFTVRTIRRNKGSAKPSRKDWGNGAGSVKEVGFGKSRKRASGSLCREISQKSLWSSI